MTWDNIDWQALARLRARFLAGERGGADYWQTDSDLDSYDWTLARRIGWKWDYVLAELGRRGWQPPAGTALDWGCGTGIASRRVLIHETAKSVTSLRLYDRSPHAVAFALARLRDAHPALAVQPWAADLDGPPALLLVSHVLGELTDPQRDDLVALAAASTAVIWVEPGTHRESHALIAVRERLRERFAVIAPCTHRAACGLLAPDQKQHWCHQFAPSPTEVYMDQGWARFARVMGVDLRRLPVSFIVLDRRPTPPLPVAAARIIGAPRVRKGFAELLACNVRGVADRRLATRRFPALYRQCKKGTLDPLHLIDCEGIDLTRVDPWPTPPGHL